MQYDTVSVDGFDGGRHFLGRNNKFSIIRSYLGIQTNPMTYACFPAGYDLQNLGTSGLEKG